MKSLRAFSLMMAVSATQMAAAEAAVVFSHSGNADPTTEGWVVEPSFAPFGRPSSGPLTGDLGLDAWSIDDNLTTIGSNWFYTQSPDAAQNSQASTNGWTLRARLRVVDSPDAVGNAGSIILEYANGVTDYRLALGAEADGDPIVLLWDGGVSSDGTTATGTSFTLQGGGSGYHLYELVYKPVAGAADLFIDGVLRVSNFTGVASSTFNRVAWGSASSSDTGQSNWNLVEWEVTAVPLPAALPLFLGGLLGLRAVSSLSRRAASRNP